MKKILGLILELNPYHNGHTYFINEAIKKVNPDLTIAIISSNFSMRGDIIIMDKFTRTSLLLDSVDVVLELPFGKGVNSADYFCYYAIEILNSFKITDLAFGVEMDDLEKLKTLATISTTPTFNTLVKKYVVKGLSYSSSHLNALKEVTTDMELIKNFSLPNNTLGIGYIKAINIINPKINITTIKRINNNYFDTSLNQTMPSAQAIREYIDSDCKDIDIGKFLVDKDYSYFNSQKAQNNLFFLLQYLFSVHDVSYFQDIYNISEGLENRFNNYIGKCCNYTEFLNEVQTKRYSKYRLQRIILYIILNIKKDYSKDLYLRILGMNKNGKKHVQLLPKEIKKQIITSFKGINSELCNLELLSTKLLGLVTSNPTLYLNEFKMPIIKEGAHDSTRD